MLILVTFATTDNQRVMASVLRKKKKRKNCKLKSATTDRLVRTHLQWNVMIIQVYSPSLITHCAIHVHCGLQNNSTAREIMPQCCCYDVTNFRPFYNQSSKRWVISMKIYYLQRLFRPSFSDVTIRHSGIISNVVLNEKSNFSNGLF